MSIESFNKTIDEWTNALQGYTWEDLTAKQSLTTWSLGQLYNHLISETTYYIRRIDVCISSNRNANKEMTDEGKAMFHNNSFPDERLTGPPSNARVPQPTDKLVLITKFTRLKQTMNERAELMEKTSFHGKSKHPGLNYLNAAEWLQFADMHMRHHLKQKKRLEDYLSPSC